MGSLQVAYGPISNVTIRDNLFSNWQNAIMGRGSVPPYGSVPSLDNVTIDHNWVDTPTQFTLGRGFLFTLDPGNLTITNNVVHDQNGSYIEGVHLADVAGALVSGNTFLRDNNGNFTAISVQGASNAITLAKNIWQTSLNPVTPYAYSSIGSSVTNLTDDGGIPISPDAVDSTPPVVSVGIADGTVISSPTPITVNASDVGSRVARVYFFVDGMPEGFSDAAPYTFALDPGRYDSGPHDMMAMAVDHSGNVSDYNYIAWRTTPELVPTIDPATMVSFWNDTVIPDNPSAVDPHAVELGVKFRAAADGYITGIRFYKGKDNTGTHVGHLWTADGRYLASAVFTGETDTGWQTASFAVPVPVRAGQTYVASYYAPRGGYAYTYNGLATGLDAGPGRVVSDAESGANGVYGYGPSNFPDQTYQATNYWVDVVYGSVKTG